MTDPARTPDCPRAEYESLLEVNAQLQEQLSGCQQDMVAWPKELPEQWSSSGFQNKLVGMAAEIGYGGDIEFYCDEFPCIAKLSGEFDSHKLKELATEVFGSPEETHLDVRTHGIVGQYGRRRLGFVAAGPQTLLDDFAKERLDKRIADLVQETESDMKREALNTPK